MPRSITPSDINDAYSLIQPYIRETPVVEIAASDFGLAGAPIVFKLEFLQVSGTFKARGAFYNLLRAADAKRGVVAASGGNHGVAIAYAARQLGRTAHIFVPSISSPAKIEKIQALGAYIHIGGETYAEALAASEEFVARTGDLPIHAYDQLETLIGQGTVGLELHRQRPAVETLLVSVGGGGLVGGIAAFYSGGVKIVGVEPEGAPTFSRALTAREPVDVKVSGVAADSLGAKRIGSLAFPILRQFNISSLLVADAEIVAAQQALWDVLRVVVEPGGAAAFAGLLAGHYRPAPSERMAVLLCGANTSAVHFG